MAGVYIHVEWLFRAVMSWGELVAVMSSSGGLQVLMAQAGARPKARGQACVTCQGICALAQPGRWPSLSLLAFDLFKF